MLARILYESGIAQTRIGTMSLGAAAFNDAVAWCMLACVIAAVKQSAAIALLAVGGGAVYAGVMVGIGRPIFQWFERVTQRDDGVRNETLAILLLALMVCAWVTDAIGIYSIFGAFVAGAVMPRGRFAREVTQLIEPVTVTLLLPLFFVYSGLNTEMNLLIAPSLFGITVLMVGAAFVCKGLGCLLAARMVGASWRESSAIGVLMNARGLMELILVNIALERKLITPALFTILVLMAILTTLVASPLYKVLYPEALRSKAGSSTVPMKPHAS